MSIITGLERARTYLIFTESALDNRLVAAAVPASRDFKRLYRGYSLAKLISDTFPSSAVEEYGDDCIKATIEANIIKKLSLGYSLSVASGTYEFDNYEVLSIDTTNNQIVVKIFTTFSDEVITFVNEQRQLYEDALGWFICAFATFTHQEIKECKVMITSTQVGESSSEAYSVSTIANFRKMCLYEGKKLLLQETFPKGF